MKNVCTIFYPLFNLWIAEENNYLVNLSYSKIEGEYNYFKSSFLSLVEKQLDSYFKRELKEFSIPFKYDLGDFGNRVLDQMKMIPYGKTLSYKDLATKIDSSAYRALGSVCNKNPIAIIIPCHRIIKSNGDYKGYAVSNEIKKYLLELEGVICER